MDTKILGFAPYLPTWEAMQAFTAERSADTPDQLWLCEHPPTFTQGLAGRAEHVLAAGDIPVVATNRGGQVTYHGVALNVAMDLSPFDRIHPCGYVALQTVDLSTIGIQTTWEDAARFLGQQLGNRLAP